MIRLADRHRPTEAELRVRLGLRETGELRHCIECGKPCKILRCRRCLLRQEKAAAGKRDYYARNKERIAAGQRDYRARNKERIAAGKRDYYARNKERIAAGQRDYRARNKERIAAGKRRHAPPTCGGCGVPIRYGGRGRPKKWCDRWPGCAQPAARPARARRTA